MKEEKAFEVNERLRIQDLSREEKSWIQFEDLTKHQSLLWTEEEQTEKLREYAEKKQARIFKELQEDYKQRKKADKTIPDEDIQEPPLDLQPTFEFTLDESTIPLLEKAINEGGVNAQFIREVEVDAEELSKLKKKYKGDQAKELNPLVCNAWLDLRPAQSQGCKSYIGRGYLKQVFFDIPEPEPEPEEEEGKKKKKKAAEEEDLDPNCNAYEGIGASYLKIEFKTIDGSYLTPITGDIMPAVNYIVPTIQGNTPLISHTKQQVKEFRGALKKTINTIIEDYGRVHSTDLSRAEELKKHGVFNDQQKRVFINKRKETYINNFYSSSKYDKLKNELVAPVMSLIHDKLEKNLTPVLFQSNTLKNEDGVKISPHTSESEQLLSEIYIYIRKELEKYTDILVNNRVAMSQMNKTIRTQNKIDETEYSNEDEIEVIHDDLVYNYNEHNFEKNKFFEEFLNQESEIKKQLNLCLEYESLNLKSLADNRYKDLLCSLLTSKEGSKFSLTKNSQLRTGRSMALQSTDRSKYQNQECQDEDEIWYQYCLFKMRDVDFVSAEEALWKAIECSGARMPKFTGGRDLFAHPLPIDPEDEQEGYEKTDPFKKRNIPEHILKYKTLMVCFYLDRGKIDLAKNLVLHLLSYDRLSTLHNTFLCFIYNEFLKNVKLSKKYFNVSQRVTMRNLGYIKSNKKNRDLPKKKKVRNKALEKLPELSENEKDEIWMELIAFFSNNYFIDLTNRALSYLKDQNTYRVNLIHSSLAFLQKDYESSDKWLDTILENNNLAQTQTQDEDKSKKNSVSKKQIGDILLRKSFNSFMNQRYYEAEEFIFRSFKNDPKLTDFSVLLRLGFIYLKRESIEDAYTVLSKACSVNSKSALVWLGLAVSALSLDRQEEAQASLRMANVLDPINSEVWGYSIILGLKDERKIEQSLAMLKKYLSLPIENLEVLNTIGEVLMNLEHDYHSYSVFFRLIQLHGDAQNDIKNLNFSLDSISPENVKATPKIEIATGHNPINPQLSNNLNKKMTVEEASTEEEPSLVSLTETEKLDARKQELLVKPIFLQENSPSSPNISLPKSYWIMGQLLHKFRRFKEAIAFYELAIAQIEGEGMKQFIIEMKQDAENMKETGTRLIAGGVTGSADLRVDEMQEGYQDSAVPERGDDIINDSIGSLVENDMY